MPIQTSRKPRQSYTKEFKQQIVDLYLNGKRKCDIIREYNVGGSVLDRWIAQAKGSGSFKDKDNRSEESNELIKLRKRNKELEMENDILKQAALIIGRK